jgi:hypothetical protein
VTSNASVYTDIEVSHSEGASGTMTVNSTTISSTAVSQDSRSSYVVDSSNLTIFPPAPLSVRERSDESSLSISSSGSSGGGTARGPGTPTYSSVVSGRILWSNAINVLNQGVSTNSSKASSSLFGSTSHTNSPSGQMALAASSDTDLLGSVPISEFILLRSALANELRLLYHSLLGTSFSFFKYLSFRVRKF